MSFLGDESKLPVILSWAQVTERAAPVRPMDLLCATSQQALDAAPLSADLIDRVSVVNVLSRVGPSPAARLSAYLGLAPIRAETTTIGGNSPQWLVNRACEDIAKGALRATLIAGVETQRSDKDKRSANRDATHAGPASDTNEERSDSHVQRDDDVVGDHRPGVSAAEMNAGLIAPVHVYALFESALAARAGRSFEEQRQFLGGLMAPLTDVAAKNPYAWFAESRSATEISETGPDNRLVTEPYTKRMCAVFNVDQSAAVVVTSLAVARRIGLADKAVFCWSGANANDVWFPTARPDPSSSPGIRAAAGAALSVSKLGVDDIDAFDLYSCFPCAIQMGAEAIGLDVTDSRGLSVTGGLPYFGGPGNNYSLHAIAAMSERIRQSGGKGLVSGLGWYVTKHSVGIYASDPPSDGYAHGDTSDEQTAIDKSAAAVADSVEEEIAEVIASTVAYDNNGIVNAAPVIARLTDGRHIAAAAEESELSALAGRNLVGQTVHLSGTMPRYRLGS